MKHLSKFFLLSYLLFVCSNVFAEQNIAYLDVKKVLNLSKAGKGAQEYLKKTFESDKAKLKVREKALKDSESQLLEQKSALAKEDYTKKVNKLRKEVLQFQTDKRNSLQKVAKLRTDAREILLEKLDPILSKYLEENSISLLLDKKTIVLGSKDLDITEKIMSILNKEVSSINLK